MKNTHIMKKNPLAYFITFTTYGTWLHDGREKSAHRHRNKPNTAYVAESQIRESAIKNVMHELPYSLNAAQRGIIINTIKNVCAYNCWDLLAAHVRTNHVHLVVAANVMPEVIMNMIKTYASRQLKSHLPNDTRLKYWTRQGSTRYLWQTEHVVLAIRYVLYEQGEPMSFYNGNKYLLNIEEFI